MRLLSELICDRNRHRPGLAPSALRAAVLLIALSALGGCSSSHSSHLAYVTMSSGINAYRIDNTSGNPTPIFSSPFVVGSSPAGIVVHPSNRFAYVANQLDNTISLLKIDTASGTLTEVLPRTAVGTGTQPALLAIDAAGTFLFVGNQGTNDVDVYSISSSGGLSSLVSNVPVGSTPTALALPTSSNVLFVSVPTFSAIYAFSVSSGSLTAVPGSPFPVANGLSSVAVAPAGNLVYVPDPSTNTISGFAVQSSGPLLKPLSGSPFASMCSSSPTSCSPFGAAVDPGGKFLYVANFGATNVSQYTIDSSTGALTSITTTTPAAGTNPAFIVFDPLGTYLYVANLGSKSITEFTRNSDGSLAANSNTIQVGSVPRGLALTR